MPDKRTHAGALDATTGKTGDAIADANSGRMYKHIQDAVNDGQMTPRAQTVAICAAILHAPSGGYTLEDSIEAAADLITRADEWDRHERLQKP